MNKTICVFCGSSTGFDEVYKIAALDLAENMAALKMNLVYGGGNIGLMGILANGLIERGRKVTGVLPTFLNKEEVGHNDLTELILVDSMHQRKQKMSDLADAFIAMPGGYGTLDELAEILAWTQLGLSKKPIGLLNVNSFFDALLKQFDEMEQQGFLKTEQRNMLQSNANAKQLLEMIDDYQPVSVPRWIQHEQI